MDSSEARGTDPRSRGGTQRFFNRANSIDCRVVVDVSAPARSARKFVPCPRGPRRPGREIVVNRDPAAHHAHEDAHVAGRDAFDAVRRLLEDHVREERGEVEAAHAGRSWPDRRVCCREGSRLHLTADGAEIYFHRNSVANGGFDMELAVGDEERFVAQHSESAEEPQAVLWRRSANTICRQPMPFARDLSWGLQYRRKFNDAEKRIRQAPQTSSKSLGHSTTPW